MLTVGIISQVEGRPTPKTNFFAADSPNIHYTGRIDFADAKKPRCWAPGVCFTVRFQGPNCEVDITDEVLYGTSHNYVEIVVDGILSQRQLAGKTNTLMVAQVLPDAPHGPTICKNTEAGIGYLKFTGLSCAELLAPQNPSDNQACFLRAEKIAHAYPQGVVGYAQYPVK